MGGAVAYVCNTSRVHAMGWAGGGERAAGEAAARPSSTHLHDRRFALHALQHVWMRRALHTVAHELAVRLRRLVQVRCRRIRLPARIRLAPPGGAARLLSVRVRHTFPDATSVVSHRSTVANSHSIDFVCWLSVVIAGFPVFPVYPVTSPVAHSRSTARGVVWARQRALQNPLKVTGCLIFPDIEFA